MGIANAFPLTTAVTILRSGNGSGLNLNNFNTTIGSLAEVTGNAIQGILTLGSATLTFGGDNTTASFAGVISGTGGVTKIGGGTVTFTGVNTYTGTTTISGGTLTYGSGGTTTNPIVAVTASGTFGALTGTSIGSTGTSGAGASLSDTGGVIDLTAAGTATTAGTFTVHDNASFVGPALSLNNATVKLAMVGSTADLLAVNGSASISGINTISMLFPATPVAGTYNLITAASGLTGTFVLPNGQSTQTVSGAILTLSNSGTVEKLTVVLQSPTAAFYTGGLSGNLSAGGNNSPTNFATDATGATAELFTPGLNTTVTFSASGAQNLATILGSDVIFAGLSFNNNAAGSISIGGSNTLTLLTGGITVAAGSPSDSIGVSNLVIGGVQTWTNNSTNPFTVSSAISGGSLTLAGSGIFILAGVDTFTSLTINSGTTVELGSGASLTAAIGGAGIITKIGTGAATLSGSVGNGGGINVTAGTLTFTGSVFTSASNVLNISSSAVAQSQGPLFLDESQDSSKGSANVIGAGTLRLTSTTGSNANPDIFFGPDQSGDSFFGAQITVATLDLGSSQRYIESNSGHNGVARYLVTSSGVEVDAYISSSIIGSGGITYVGNASTIVTTFFAPLVLAGANTFSGKLEVDQGSVYLFNANALNLSQGNAVVLNNNGNGYSHLFLLGNNATISNLTSSGISPNLTGIANGNPDMGFNAGATTLTILQTASTSFGGTIANTITDGFDSGSDVPAAIGVTTGGSGTLILTAASNYTGSTNISGGTLTLNTGSSLSSTSITVATGAALNVNVNAGLSSSTALTSNGTTTLAANTGTGQLPRTLASLTVNSGGVVTVAPSSIQTNRTVLITNTLNMNGGTLNLTTNDLVVHSGSGGETVLPTILSQLSTGRGSNGLWTGTGITSSAAAGSPSTMALGAILNDTNASNTNAVTRGTLSGTGLLTAFDGQTIHDGDVVVKYTFVGDANGSGAITAADYIQIDNAFSYNAANPTTPMKGWYNGDFNYDGVINGDDYTLIDNAFNTQGGVTFAGVPAQPLATNAATIFAFADATQTNVTATAQKRGTKQTASAAVVQPNSKSNSIFSTTPIVGDDLFEPLADQILALATSG